MGLGFESQRDHLDILKSLINIVFYKAFFFWGITVARKFQRTGFKMVVLTLVRRALRGTKQSDAVFYRLVMFCSADCFAKLCKAGKNELYFFSEHNRENNRRCLYKKAWVLYNKTPTLLCINSFLKFVNGTNSSFFISRELVKYF